MLTIMDVQMQTELGDLLVAYFGDLSLEAGVAEMIFVSRNHEDQHRKYMRILQAGIEAAERGDPDLVALVKRRYAPLLANREYCRDLLRDIDAEYRAQYASARATRDDSNVLNS
jgi:hypothetical protein